MTKRRVDRRQRLYQIVLAVGIVLFVGGAIFSFVNLRGVYSLIDCEENSTCTDANAELESIQRRAVVTRGVIISGVVASVAGTAQLVLLQRSRDKQKPKK